MLWIPPPHTLNHVRLALWFGIANTATREYYVFITSKEGMHLTKMGANAFAIAVVLVEIMVVIKHGRGVFDAPWPAGTCSGDLQRCHYCVVVALARANKTRSAHEAR